MRMAFLLGGIKIGGMKKAASAMRRLALIGMRDFYLDNGAATGQVLMRQVLMRQVLMRQPQPTRSTLKPERCSTDGGGMVAARRRPQATVERVPNRRHAVPHRHFDMRRMRGVAA
jgi:hypothetical protein